MLPAKSGWPASTEHKALHISDRKPVPGTVVVIEAPGTSVIVEKLVITDR
jgi:hypothetical protein